MKKIVFFLIILLFLPSPLYSQDWGFAFEILPIGIGVGIGFDHEYSFLVKGKETKFEIILGYIWDNEEWYGLGNNPSTEPDTNTEFTMLQMSNIYIKQELIQTIIGDHYAKDYYFDIGLRLFSQFKIPMIFDNSKQFFQSDTILGDKLSLYYKFTLLCDFTHLDDPFWTSLGMKIYNEINIHAGSELDWRFWTFLSNYNQLDFWFPIIGEFLFFHILGIGEFASSSFNNNVPLSFYSYPFLDGDKVRGIDKTYRDLILMSGSLELISRFLKFELFFPMSIGLGLFGDMGLVDNNIAKVSVINLNSSFGAFVEYRVCMDMFSVGITTHIGIVFFVSKNESEECILVPKFYFNLFFLVF